MEAISISKDKNTVLSIQRFFKRLAKGFHPMRLIKDMPSYFRTYISILTHPFSFIENTDISQDDQFWKASDFASLSLLIIFLLMIPVYIMYHKEMSKGSFFVYGYIYVVLYGFLLHYALKLFGARNYLTKQTITVYCYFTGLTNPILFLIFYPVLLKLGPDSFKAGAHWNISLSLAAYTIILLSFYIVLTYIMLVKWFSVTHKISKLKIFFVILLVCIFGSVLTTYIVDPAFNKILSAISSSTLIKKLF